MSSRFVYLQTGISVGDLLFLANCSETSGVDAVFLINHCMYNGISELRRRVKEDPETLLDIRDKYEERKNAKYGQKR